MGLACGGSGGGRPVARVAGLPLHDEVVAQLAARDELSPAQARARAIDTLRLVAAGRAEHAGQGDDPGPVLSPRRAEHLRRAALARLWLTERFEPEHGPEDVPDDDPRLLQARKDPRMVHPELVSLCQVVVEPPDVEDLSDKAAITEDPAWREAASRALAPVLARIERTVAVGDPDACPLLMRTVELSGPGDDPQLRVTSPRAGGFDLDACLERDDAGACVEPRFAPEWTEQVRAMEVPGFSAPFFTRFGLHVVYAHERLPARPAGDPATEAALREAVLDAWRADALDRRLDALRQASTVRVASPREDGG